MGGGGRFVKDGVSQKRKELTKLIKENPRNRER